MSPQTPESLYEEMKRMPVEERVRFFSLSLTEIHQELRQTIAQLEAMRLALEESEQNHRHLVETAQDAVITIDMSGHVLNWNRAAERMFGWTAEEAIGGNLGEMIVPEEHREQHTRGLARFQAQQPSNVLNRCVEITAQHRTKGVFPIELSIWPHQQSGKQIFSAIIRDITERKQREQIAWLHANFDALTGLPNRRLLVNRLEQAVAQAARHQNEVALLFIDLDRFKPVNDSYGHAVGDELLRLVAFRLQSLLREEDTVARLGGDEFIALLPGLRAGETAAQQTVERIIAALAQPCLVNEHTLHISGSVGIALFPHDAADADSLLKCADTAMFEAKELGRATRPQ